MVQALRLAYRVGNMYEKNKVRCAHEKRRFHICYPSKRIDCPVGWGCRIHQLYFCRAVRPPPNECSRYDTKQSVAEAPVMLNLAWFGLIWFYGMSNIVGYLMPNPFYTYIEYMISKQISR